MVERFVTAEVADFMRFVEQDEAVAGEAPANLFY